MEIFPMPSLATQLKSIGFEGEPDHFKDVLVDTLHNLYPNWNDEKLTRNPKHAEIYCEHVRCQIRMRLEDEFILGTLANIRKRGRAS
jgi:hypothetical protein